MSTDSAGGRYRQVLRAVSHVMAVVGAVGILALTVISVTNVAWRNVAGGQPFDAVGLGEVAIAGIALLGAAHAQRHDVHVRVTLLVRFLSQRAAAITRSMTLLISAAIIGWVALETGSRALISWQANELRFGEIWIWPARAAIALAFAVLFLELVLELTDALRDAIRGAGAAAHEPGNHSSPGQRPSSPQV